MARIEHRRSANGIRLKYKKDTKNGKKGEYMPGRYSYWVTWNTNEKRVSGRKKVGYQKAGTDLANAKKILAKITTGQVLGSVGLDVESKITTQQAFESYIKWKEELKDGEGKPKFSPETIQHINGALRGFLLKRGLTDLGQWVTLKRKEPMSLFFQKWYDDEVVEYCVNGANIRYRAIKAFFEWCVTRGHMDRNPAKMIEIFPDEEVGRALSPEEVHLAITKGCESNPELRDIITVFLGTGFRLSACLFLMREQVTEYGIKLGRRTRAGAKSRSKTKKEFYVPINPKILPILTKVASGRIFPTWSDKSSLENAWSRAKKRCGITERARIHDLRHTAASWLLQYGGWTLREVQQFLGHSSLKTTERYAHLEKNYLQEKMRTVDLPIIPTPAEPELQVI